MRIILAIALAGTVTAVFAAKPVWSPKTYGPYQAEHLSTYDGDTFWARVHIWPAQSVAIKIRVIGTDTPEFRSNRRKVPECEKVPAEAARVFADDFMRDALPGSIILTGVKFDAYADRMDAVVKVDGYDLAEALNEAGHGRVYFAKKAQGTWCGDTP